MTIADRCPVDGELRNVIDRSDGAVIWHCDTCGTYAEERYINGET